MWSVLLQDAYDKVSAMRQEIEASDRKIKNLTKSLQSSCKMRGKPSCAETILLVTDHLNRRTCCRFIRQDLQVFVPTLILVTTYYYKLCNALCRWQKYPVCHLTSSGKLMNLRIGITLTASFSAIVISCFKGLFSSRMLYLSYNCTWDYKTFYTLILLQFCFSIW